MILIPAIDLKGGKVVRLFQGKFSEVTEYSNAPLEVAQKWKDSGADWLHLIDLDGAQTGIMKNSPNFIPIIKQVGVSVQIGGRIRSFETVEMLIGIGADRII